MAQNKAKDDLIMVACIRSVGAGTFFTGINCRGK